MGLEHLDALLFIDIAYSTIKFADLIFVMLLQKAVHDPLQKITARDNVVVEVVLFKADKGVHDTGNSYYLENVSYGDGVEYPLSDLVTIEFDENKVTAARIDERNLVLC